MWSLPNTKETGSAESSLIVTCWIILSHVLHSANHASLKQLRPHQKPGATHKCEATSNESARLTPFSRRVVIWFGSGSSVFLRYPLGVYAATCRSWIGMKAKLGCRGMPHTYYPHGTNSTPKRVQQSSMVARQVHQSSSRDQCRGDLAPWLLTDSTSLSSLVYLSRVHHCRSRSATALPFISRPSLSSSPL